ncbi:MAG: excinuclease ABC subunit UvrA [Planctomycetes bacterium]|nr:excinuclease ABC subunit UvrA [Planctomycetota bacterium]
MRGDSQVDASDKCIVIKGAAAHNLKRLDLRIPRDKLVVITGLSGSGKSSLAFDTIFAEGQRRYVESLSSYARQFLEQMEKPEVESVEGLPPTISIEQRTGIASPRSTVATTTEVYDYLRLLYARAGEPHCPQCGRPIRQQSPEQIVEAVLALPKGVRVMVLAPMVRGRKGEHKEILDRIGREGLVRVRVDGQVFPLEEAPKLDKRKLHTVEAVVDRLVVDREQRSRLHDSVETALALGEGLVIISRGMGGRMDEWMKDRSPGTAPHPSVQSSIHPPIHSSTPRPSSDAWDDVLYSQHYGCPECGVSIEELAPRLFSFNSPYGACPTCSGLGTCMEFDPDLIVPDPSLSLAEGAIHPWRRGEAMASWYNRALERFCRDFGAAMTTPFEKLPAEARRALLHGAESAFKGVIPDLAARFRKTQSDSLKSRLMGYMGELPCAACKGARLRPEARAVTVGGRAIHELTALSIADAHRFLSTVRFSPEKAAIAQPILKEAGQRLQFMIDVGIGYLTLDRPSGSLAGGEAQRIRLATQVGSGLVGVCYVLDEPTIGLHQRDNARLIATLRRLQGLGNTVIVVEHDEQTIRSANHIIDLGPGAGLHGGHVVAQGTLADILAAPASLTGQYLSGRLAIETPKQRRPVSRKKALVIRGAAANNLKRIDAAIPLGGIVCVTGVSGSGKSTLVNDVLHRALMRHFHASRAKPGEHRALEGIEQIDKVIIIDQSPIGRTPRSNPATYTGVFDDIRRIFAGLKDAKVRGYQPGRFSFNVKGGRCEACEGQGTKRIEMHFLPDLYVTCEACRGRRYNRETLDIRYKGRSIADVLDMQIEEALAFFNAFPRVKRILQTLHDVGLDYMALGQSSTTLSGGEAQRIKLSTELAKVATGNTLYILDEPTTGLHFADISRLLDVLHRLADRGNTLLVIEHNPDVIKCADWILDLGPEGGDEGGRIVAEGPPEAIAADPASYTGQVLAHYLRCPHPPPSQGGGRGG